jgi:hypothetical protein
VSQSDQRDFAIEVRFLLGTQFQAPSTGRRDSFEHNQRMSREKGASLDGEKCGGLLPVRNQPRNRAAANLPRPERLGALDFSSSRMMRRNVSSNLGAFPVRYSRSAALINV